MLLRVDLGADFKSQLEVTCLHSQCELFLRVLGQVYSCRSIAFADQVPNQILLLFSKLILDHFVDLGPLLLVYCKFELNIEILGALYLKDLPGCIEGEEFPLS